MNITQLNFLADCIIMNSDARMEMSDADHKYVPCGNPVEVSLLKFLCNQTVYVQDKMIERERNYKLEAKIPFSSERKRMTVAYRLPGENIVRVVVKGAPESLIPLCVEEKNASN